jgi:HK97 family phage major capsid protein
MKPKTHSEENRPSAGFLMPVVRDSEPKDNCIVRSFAIERLRDEKKQETTYRVSLSSEAPIQDWWQGAPNILVHEKDSVEFDAERGIPFFENHDARDLDRMSGRIVNLRIERKRLVGELRFSEANPRAAMVREMIDEGTLTDMSIRAEPIKRERVEENGKTVAVRWTKWRALEASAVGIGADQSVGIGRSSLDDKSANAEGVSMADESTAGAGADKSVERSVEARIEAGRQEQDKDFAVRMDQERSESIRKLGQANQISEDIVQAWIKRGTSFDRIADDILEIQKKRGEKGGQSVSALDLTEREKKQYSLSRAILASSTGQWKEAGFELECDEAIRNRLNKPTEAYRFFVPEEIQRRQAQVTLDQIEVARAMGVPFLQRELSAGVAASAGVLVGTRVVGFDEVLRNTSVVMHLGASTLPGLRENVTIPRQTGAATPEWLTTETGGPTETLQTFVQLALSPKTVAATTGVTRKLLQQSSIAVDSLINADLGASVALTADKAALSGTGTSGQPMGIDAVTGVGTFNGTTIAYTDILAAEADLATGNVTPMRPGLATTPTVANLLRARVKFSGTASPIWEGNLWNGSVNGYTALASNQVASSTAYFGDWSKLVIAEWGTLEIDTNPYGTGWGAGVLAVRAIYSMDVGVRYPVAFTIATSIS